MLLTPGTPQYKDVENIIDELMPKFKSILHNFLLDEKIEPSILLSLMLHEVAAIFGCSDTDNIDRLQAYMLLEINIRNYKQHVLETLKEQKEKIDTFTTTQGE